MLKKLLLLLTISLSFNLYAQEIGIRWGNIDGNDIAIDGTIPISETKRIHADVGLGDSVSLDVLYDFWYRHVFDEPQLKWYLGMGVSSIFSDFNIGPSAEAGIQYNFKFPVSISIDWRPTLWLIDDLEFKGDYFGLNLRFRF